MCTYLEFGTVFSTVMAEKHLYQIIDLLDKNEGKNDDMLDIAEEIHKFVPKMNVGPEYDDGKNILQRIVFGGDVLTNKQAYTAQKLLANATNEHERHLGMIHRPEGLHMNMNFCKYLIATFFTSSTIFLCNYKDLSKLRHNLSL